MESRRLPLVGQQYTALSRAVSVQDCINLYPEKVEDPNERAKGLGFLTGCPGRHLFTTLGGTIRGLWSGGGRLFAAAGGTIYEVTSGGGFTALGAVANDGLPVQIFPNGNQIFIVSGGLCYVSNGGAPNQIFLGTTTSVVYRNDRWVEWRSGDLFAEGLVGGTVNIGGTLYTVQEVLSPILLFLTAGVGFVTTTMLGVPSLTARTGAFLDGYFIAAQVDSRQFNISPLLDGTNRGTYQWDPTSLAVKESYPDYIQGILACNEQLYLFGTETFEVWQNTGQGVGGFPFERINGASGRFGSVSPWGPIAIGGRVFFIGGDSTGELTAYMMNGFTPQRISTHAEEAQWKAAGLGPNCVSYAYMEEGHNFWVIHFGTQTWAYDLITGAWHRRAAWSGTFTEYPTKFHAFVPEWGTNGKHITGGSLNGSLYESSIAFYDDAGQDMKWQRTLPYIYEGGKRVFLGNMELEMETGTAPSGDPAITRERSDDRGQTFTFAETANIGSAGQYGKRVYWPSGGSSHGRVWRISGVGQYPVRLIDCVQDVAVGDV